MSLLYSQWIWGFEVFDAGSLQPQNNLLDFDRSAGTSFPGTVQALLNPGVYTAYGFANEVARAMNQVDRTGEYTCSFDFLTQKFTVTNTEPVVFTLKSHDGAGHAQGPWALLGFDTASNPTTATSAASNSGVGGTYSPIVKIWTAADPLVLSSPTIPGTGGAVAARTQRVLNTKQNISDGATIESVYVSTLRRVQIAFRALTSTEQDKMETFLDWISTGKPFTWQPDNTSANFMELVLANPGEVNNMFEWLTRQETSYGTLSFFEQASA